MWLQGGYRKPVNRTYLNRAIIGGGVLVLLIYALLPETMRFSRAVVVVGTVWALLAVNVLRTLLSKAHLIDVDARRLSQRIAIVGGPQETERVLNMVQSINTPREFVGLIMTQPAENENYLSIGRVEDLHELLTIYQINEVIFCARDIPADQIIDWMGRLQDMQIEYKIAPEDSLSLIGSNSIFTAEDLYTIPLQPVYQRRNRSLKRCFDFLTALLLLVGVPLDIWFVKEKGQFVRNIFDVLLGRKSWVGIRSTAQGSASQLLHGVLSPADAYPNSSFSPEMVARTEELYVKNYCLRNDMTILVKGFRKLGNC